MAKNNNLTDFVTDLANAIRAKCKTTGKINPQDFSEFVGGMPFFKFRQTVDITSPADMGKALPLSYNQFYIKGEIYLTNDNGYNEIAAEDGTAMVIVTGIQPSTLFSINKTSDRFQIFGYPSTVKDNTGYTSFIAGGSDGNGGSLISAGWHIKIDIYELYIGNPDGENTPLDLNTANGGGTL